jgi:hypothetical protein
MRFKINLDISQLPVENIVVETSRVLNRMLGNNHKWHNLENKPYTCSLISGGTLKGRTVVFADNAHFFFNTNDEEVIETMVSNEAIDFEIIPIKIFKGYNLLSLNSVRYKTKGKNKWVTEENKNDFIKYVKNKYGVKIDILKYDKSVVHYKNSSKIPVSNLLVKVDYSKTISNLFETGIGASSSLGLGFIEPIKKD